MFASPSINKKGISLMNRVSRLLKAPIFLMLGFLAGSALADKTSPAASQTYITVNGKAIPKSRADVLASSMPPARGQNEAEAMRKSLGDELVRRELAAQEAVKRGIDTRPDIRAQIDLAVQSVLVNAYYADYLREHPVTEETIKREYESIRATLGNREFKVRHILLGSEAEAQGVIDKLGRGAKFNELAAQSKDVVTKDRGGDLGWINAATYVQPFSEAMTKLQKGKYTYKPVQSEFGWHVIQLDDIRELKMPTLAELKPQLLPRLQQQTIERHMSELRSRAKIE
jgi:peptidyl-prolyl cis-trans isomerase C